MKIKNKKRLIYFNDGEEWQHIGTGTIYDSNITDEEYISVLINTIEQIEKYNNEVYFTLKGNAYKITKVV